MPLPFYRFKPLILLDLFQFNKSKHKEDGIMKLMRRHKSYPHHLKSYPDDERASIVALAYHEAGHAVFCWRNGRSLGRFGMILNPHDRIGLCTLRWIVGTEKRAHLYENLRPEEEFVYTDLEFLISGPAAQDKFWKSMSKPTCGFGSSWADYDAAKYIIEKKWCKDNPDSFLKKEYRRVSRLLDHPRTWKAVEGVVHALLKFQYLNDEQLNSIIEKIKPPKRESSLI
jgi:hypothetical protein